MRTAAVIIGHGIEVHTSDARRVALSSKERQSHEVDMLECETESVEVVVLEVLRSLCRASSTALPNGTK